MHLAVVVADLGRFAWQSPFIARTKRDDVVIVDRHCPPSDLACYLQAWSGKVDSAELVLTDLDHVDCAAGAHDWRPDEASARCAVCGKVEELPTALPAFDRLIYA